MTSRITIEIDDHSLQFCVVWPDGTKHSYRMTPPQSEHSIKNKIADEINRMMMVPELCSAGAGGLQYSLEEAVAFSTETGFPILFEGGCWTIVSPTGDFIASNVNLTLAINDAEEHLK